MPMQSEWLYLDQALTPMLLRAQSWSSLQYPAILKLGKNQFQIVNTAVLGTFGEHWILLAHLRGNVCYFDSFEREPENSIVERLEKFGQRIIQIFPSTFGMAPQSPETTTCGLYCIYMAHVLYSNKLTSFISEDDILQFACERFCVNFVKHVLYL